MNNMLISVLAFFCYVHNSNALQCRDEENNPVDWYVLYKIPKLKQQNLLIEQGSAYIYLASNHYGSWQISNKSINNTNSIIGNTLQNLYSSKNDVLYILYNDEPPNENKNSNKGHTKGVVMADMTGGFWVVHSVPNFPEMGSSYAYPENGVVYGQSFLCISMDLKNLNKVGIQLQYNQPEIYGENVPSNLKSLVPNLAKAAANVTVDSAPWYHITNLYSKSGVQFTSFAKSKQFCKDLYEDLVAPYLESDLVVETWPNGPGRLPSDCKKLFKVNNVESINIPVAEVSFKATHDHSKWSVTSTSSKKYWTCIGDINRAAHQEVRGGGTVCLNNEVLTKNYQTIVETIEKC
ncbi:deoxyribonuclease II [Leptinotarsa decemlineata]|uniref:deoxyribonuclease II n=1 Tax=Leptinotarsa decemlineata TaxID=7539 RepID=UPI003D3058E0